MSAIQHSTKRTKTSDSFTRANTGKDADNTARLATALCNLILTFLSPDALARSSLISKRWCEFAGSSKLWNDFDYSKLFPTLKVFGGEDWKGCVDLKSLGLSIDDAPVVDRRKDISKLWKFRGLQVEGDAGTTLLTIPKGLTLNALIKLGGLPKFKDPVVFRWCRILVDQANLMIDHTYRIVITNHILAGSRRLSYKAQEDLVHGFGYKVPSILEASALVIVTYLSSNVRLYNKPNTIALCSGKANCYMMSTADLGCSSFNVTILPNDGDQSDRKGMGAVRKFDSV